MGHNVSPAPPRVGLPVVADDAVLVSSPQYISRRIAQECILVPIRGRIGDLEAVLTLDEVGAFVWDQIDGRRTVREIVEAVEAAFEVTWEQAETDVKAFLAELIQLGCLVPRS